MSRSDRSSDAGDASTDPVGGAHGPESGEYRGDTPTGTVALAAMGRCDRSSDHSPRWRRIHPNENLRLPPDPATLPTRPRRTVRAYTPGATPKDP